MLSAPQTTLQKCFRASFYIFCEWKKHSHVSLPLFFPPGVYFNLLGNVFPALTEEMPMRGQSGLTVSLS